MMLTRKPVPASPALPSVAMAASSDSPARSGTGTPGPVVRTRGNADRDRSTGHPARSCRGRLVDHDAARSRRVRRCRRSAGGTGRPSAAAGPPQPGARPRPVPATSTGATATVTSTDERRGTRLAGAGLCSATRPGPTAAVAILSRRPERKPHLFHQGRRLGDRLEGHVGHNGQSEREQHDADKGHADDSDGYGEHQQTIVARLRHEGPPRFGRCGPFCPQNRW